MAEKIREIESCKDELIHNWEVIDCFTNYVIQCECRECGVSAQFILRDDLR